MTTPTQTLHYPSFRRWIGQQGGDYQTKDNRACPMALWAKEVKRSMWPSAGWAAVVDGNTLAQYNIVPQEAGVILIGELVNGPHTYEALTKRLDAQFTKTGLRRRAKRRPPYEPTGPLGSFKRGAAA